LKARWLNENAMQLDYVRSEIERMRTQVHRQRGEIRQLQRAGISTASAEEALLERMLNKIDELCAERDKLKKKSAWANQRQSPRGTSVVTELKRYDHTADNPPWINALAEVRHRATREGYCYHHVQAIIVSIDQYAETALGIRTRGRALSFEGK
jgi:hypothetical protein